MSDRYLSNGNEKLVTFLAILMRDKLSYGEVARLVNKVCEHCKEISENLGRNLVEYAKILAEMLQK